MLPAAAADTPEAEAGYFRQGAAPLAISLTQPHQRDLTALADLLTLSAAALAIRAALIAARSLWFDEVFSVEIARAPLSQGLALLRTDAHPPLYYLLLHAWLRLGDSPAAVRGLSLLFGTLTVALTYLFARRVGGRGLGLGAGLLLAASALAVQSSVEARMYALLGCFTLAATWALWEAAARQRPKLWIVYAVVLTVAIYLDYFAFLLVPVHVAYVAWTSRADARALRGLLLALGGALVAYGPWWPSLADQFVRGHLATFWNGRMPLTAPLDTVALAAFGGRLLGLGDYLIGSGRVTAWQLLLVLPFLALVLLGTRCLSRREDGALLLACWAVPLIVLIGASLFTGIHYAVPRYGGFLQPFFAVLLASGVLRVARVRVGAGLPVVLLAAIVALNLSVLAAGARGSHPFDWAAAARHIDQRWQEGDGVLFYPHTARLVFGYYFRRSGAPVLTLYPPYQRGGGEAVDMRRTLPVVPTLLPGARRVWVVLTVPTPAGSTEALLSAMGRWYRLSEAQDFHYVWIYLFEKPR